MSWSFPHWVEFHDGTAWRQTETFENYDAAAHFARTELGQDNIDDGLVVIVPEIEPAETRRLVLEPTDPWGDR